MTADDSDRTTEKEEKKVVRPPPVDPEGIVYIQKGWPIGPEFFILLVLLFSVLFIIIIL